MTTKKEGQHMASPINSQIHHTTACRETHQAVEASIEQLNNTGAGHYRHLRQTQSARLVHYLYVNDKATTAELAGSLAIGNISDSATKARKVLNLHGLTICSSHPDGMRNRYGQATPMHIWWLADWQEVGA